MLPKIRGSTIKNENSAAFILFVPRKTALEIVEPLLEIEKKQQSTALPVFEI